MIEKMKFISITGPKADIDRMTDKYLSHHEIQLENAMIEYKDSPDIAPFLDVNPYTSSLDTVRSLSAVLRNKTQVTPKEMTAQEAQSQIDSWKNTYEDALNRQTELKAQLDHIQKTRDMIAPFKTLDYSLEELVNYKYVKVRFGRIEKRYYTNFVTYIHDNQDTIFQTFDEDGTYIYGMYMAPASKFRKISAVYAAMHFDPIRIPDEYKGTVKEIYEELDQKDKEVAKELRDSSDDLEEYLRDKAADILGAESILERYSTNFDIRKMAAVTKIDEEPSYILCGWMPESETTAFLGDVVNDHDVYCMIDDKADRSEDRNPPTKLKNPKAFKPFEMYTKMYGLPAYNEMDPTWFVAITYSFIFGVMFGDVGQGLVLCIGGFLLYRFKKMDLAGIIGCAGIFSTIFGFMFGSIFGFEDIIKPVWLRPKEAMMQVPFIGRLNTVFVIAIGFGMFIILICMVFNIINEKRAGNKEGIWIDTNAVTGLVFYGAIVICAFLLVAGKTLPAMGILMIFFLVPLILIFLKEPIFNAIEKKKLIEGSVGMFIAQGFFELFEVLLSYFSNTLSFVRIGAFAVSHAAMMEVVLMLAGAESGSPNFIVIVLGNLFVCGLEGLIVGIQVLRLEYYEIFSRFYKGSGRAFRPYGK